MKFHPITFRLAIAFCLLATVLLIVGWQGISHLQRLETQLKNVIYQRWQNERLARQAFHLSDDNSRITLLVFIVNDPKEIDRLLDQRSLNTNRISDLVTTIEPKLDTEKEKTLLATVKALRAPYIVSYERALALLLTQRKPDEARQMMVAIVRPNLVAYHDAWNAFDQCEVDEVEQAVLESKTEYATGERDFLLTLLLAGLIAGAIAIFTVARLNREMDVRLRAEQSLWLAHDQLEQRVLDRTAEMQKANEALRVEIDEHKKTTRQLQVQYAVSRVLAGSSTIEQAAPQILQALCENLGWDAGELWSVDPRMDVLRCVDLWSVPDLPAEELITISRPMTLARGISLPGRVWAGGQPVWIRHINLDTNCPRAQAAERAGLQGAFGFPIMTGNELVAVIGLFSREVREHDDSLLPIFSALGSQIGQFFQRRRLEDHLLQSQKMETVGKLAGGIAHEFNSIMTAIIGQSEMLLGELTKGSQSAQSAKEIRLAADRAATLTRQLLAYGRRQIMQPAILDLNKLVTGMENMLLHLMGADVDVRIIPAAGLKEIHADAGQIEQVIMNIAINAREAMPHGGKLTLETATVSFEEGNVNPLQELKPGHYVMLAITDTGTGMSAKVQGRVFDPFFSTKDVGQGTGLGLATCYGIVKQSGGHINIYSEPERGTTVKVYLPLVRKTTQAPLPQPAAAPNDLPHGTETILLVEDDSALRQMSSTFLRRLGYIVKAAANGTEALDLLSQQNGNPLDLLFTDVVMPKLDGKGLSDRVRVLYPGAKVLFTTAYTENAIVHQGVLDPGVALLPKPFTPSAMAHKVREVLDQR